MHMCKIDGRGGEGGWSKSRILGRNQLFCKIRINMRGYKNQPYLNDLNANYPIIEFVDVPNIWEFVYGSLNF